MINPDLIKQKGEKGYDGKVENQNAFIWNCKGYVIFTRITPLIELCKNIENKAM